MSQDLYLDTITEISGAGTSGVSLKDLFEKRIPKLLVDSVWDRLKAARGDVVFYQGDIVVGHDDSKLQSYQSAIRSGIQVKATNELYHAYLGIYGQELQRFQYSEPQVTTLFLVQKAGRAGIPQNELCASIGLKPNNFGYVMQALEERGKIFRRKATVKRKDQKGNTFTHFVYLMRYKSEVDTSSDEAGTAQFQNDEFEFQKILDELEKSDVTTDSGEKLAIESHLKAALKFTGDRQGHKRWRRLRDKMLSLHLIESFRGVTTDGKEENFIKKIQSSATGEMVQEKAQPSFDMPVRTLAHQVVELSMDRQFLIEIAKSGVGGATSSDLTEILGFNLKRHHIRFQEFEVRFKGAENKAISLNVNKTVVGRSSQNVYSVTKGVAENILNANEALVGTDFVGHVLARFTGGTVPDDARGSSDEHDPSIKKYYTDAGQELTTDFSYRLHWLVEIVKEKGFFLSMQASEYLLQREKERKGSDKKLPKEIDKKQIMRVAQMAEKHKLLHIAEVQVPNRSGVTGSQNVTVFLPNDATMSEELLEKVLKVYLDNFKAKYANNSSATPAAKPLVRGNFKKEVRPQQASSFSIYGIQQANGYHSCKMHRCKVLLECIVRMVESRSSDYTLESFENLLQQLETSNSEIRCILEIPEMKSVAENGGIQTRRKEISVFKPTMDSKRYIFTLEQVWRALTVDEFAKALGAACRDKQFLDQNRSTNVGELSKDDLIKIAGGEAQNTSALAHLKKVLEMLTQIGVLKSIVPFGMSKEARRFSRLISGRETGYYMFNPVAVHETGDSPREPLSPFTEDNTGCRALKSFDLTCPRERKGYWISLQYLYCYNSKQNVESNPSNHRGTYFPMDRTEKNFARSDRLAKNVEKVKSEIADPDRAAMSWEQILDLATHLDVPVDDVIHALTDTRLRKPKRLGGLNRKSSKGPRNRKVKDQNINTQETSTGNIIEEEEEELLLLQPESQSPPTRKRKWHENEDRQLLYAWIGWLAVHGANARIQWSSMLKNLPTGIKAGSYKNRIAKLSSDECVKEYVMEIKSEADSVFARHSSLKDPSDLKVKKKHRFTGPNLFEVKGDDDLKSIQTIVDKIERIVQEAPERPVEAMGASSSRIDKFAKSYLVRSSPSEYLVWMRNYCEKAKLVSDSRQVPSIEVTSAMAVALASLYEIEYLGKAPEGIKKILGGRFSPETLKNACKNLAQNDLIIAESVAGEGTHLSLSQRFKVEMKPPFSPLSIIENNKFLFSGEKGLVWPLSSVYTPLSVSPMLALNVMGHAPFEISIPDDVQDALTSSVSGENVLSQLGEHCLERNMVYQYLRDPAEACIVCHASPADCPHVLYQPNDLLESSEIYQMARNDFLKEAKGVLGANFGNAILETVTNAGPNGMTMNALQSLLELNNLSTESMKVGKLLQKYGVARIIKGYNETYVASCMATGHLVSVKTLSDAMEIDDKPLSESPLRPWMNADGKLIEPLWVSFVMRVVDIVCRFPGIDGEMLIQTLRSLPPSFAKEVIESMCQAGVLHFTVSPSNGQEKLHTSMECGILSDSLGYSLEESNATCLNDIFAVPTAPFARYQPSDCCFFVDLEKFLDAKSVMPPYVC